MGKYSPPLIERAISSIEGYSNRALKMVPEDIKTSGRIYYLNGFKWGTKRAHKIERRLPYFVVYNDAQKPLLFIEVKRPRFDCPDFTIAGTLILEGGKKEKLPAERFPAVFYQVLYTRFGNDDIIDAPLVEWGFKNIEKYKNVVDNY